MFCIKNVRVKFELFQCTYKVSSDIPNFCKRQCAITPRPNVIQWIEVFQASFSVKFQ